MAKGNLYRERSIEATRLHQGTLSETKRRIAKLYEQAAEDLASTAGRAKSSLTRQWANSYIKEMRGRVHELWQDVGVIARQGMAKEAPRGVAIQTGLLGDAADLAHLDLKSRFVATFARTPDEAIAAVAQGKLYSGPKAILSKRIWRNAELQAGQIEEVILQGLAKQQSPVQLAKALQAYVNPKALQPSNWNDIYDNCPFPLRVDYNAKRLAVTSINHAYYSAAILTGRDNPFAVGIQWELSKFHVIYDVCDLYMEHDEGLGIGVYSFDNAPIPHPFCKCNWYVTEGERSLEEIARELYRWEQGESNPRLDRAFGAWTNEAPLSLYRQSAHRGPPMDKNRLKKMVAGLKHNGIDVWMDEESERYLDDRNCDASNFGEVLIFRKDVTASEFFEEVIHSRQHREGKISSNPRDILACEIEAAEKLLKYQKQYGIVDIEAQATAMRLEKLYKEFADCK